MYIFKADLSPENCGYSQQILTHVSLPSINTMWTIFPFFVTRPEKKDDHEILVNLMILGLTCCQVGN